MKSAFSLVEMLVVVAIIAILGAIVLPGFTSVAAGSNLTRAERAVADQMALARQEAAGRHREVQVRFLWRSDSPEGYRGIQLWVPTPRDVTRYVPYSRTVWLPDGTLLSSSTALSPLLAAATIPETTTNLPGLGSTKFTGFRFRPGGATDLPFHSSSNFVTVVRESDASATAPPANFAVIQLDPVNGRVRTFRP